MSAAFRHIIVLCTGNICRSPMAAALLHRELAPLGVAVSSAGVNALVGDIDIGAHRGRQATSRLLSDADLVLTASGGHARWVLDRFPALRGRVFRLTRWNGDRDIPDPYGEARIAFEMALEKIDAAIAEWLPRLR